MLALALGIVALAVLAIIGRHGKALRLNRQLPSVLLSVLAAAGAVAAALRGAWVIGLAMIGLAVWLGLGGRRTVAETTRSGEMQPSEARAILDVGPEASTAEIEAAWRRLMLRAHPDHGGSPGLAAQLNAARARLIKKT
ncbi:MAG TPA: molecular chaperone DnaJ [Caulobacteraceae bacterium]|jgi:hypothetical protein